MRLDLYLFENGFAKSRSFAKTLVDEGYVTVNGKHIRKPSFDVPKEANVEVTGKPYEFVSRGGVKLSAAITGFSVDVKDKLCVDIGASTGGFTDCLLRNGAKKVFAVDCGSGQLAEELKSDARVVSIENFNARELSEATLGTLCDIAVCDVSFISQTLIHPAVNGILKDTGVFISLIKPQFECGRDGTGKGGIVKSDEVRIDAVRQVISSAENNGLGCTGLLKSPIYGGDGNTEYLMICEKDTPRKVGDAKINEIIKTK